MALETTGGITFLMSNYEDATGRYVLSDWETVHKRYLNAEPEEFTRNQTAYRLGLERIVSDPVRILKLVPMRLGYLFDLEGREHVFLYTSTYFGPRSRAVILGFGWALLLSFPLLVVAAVVSLSFGPVPQTETEALVLWVLGVMLVQLLTVFGDARFHLPLVPLFAILAVRPWTGAARTRSRGRMVAGSVVLIAALVWWARVYPIRFTRSSRPQRPTAGSRRCRIRVPKVPKVPGAAGVMNPFRLAQLGLVVIATAAALVPWPSQSIERYFSHGVYPALQGRLTSWSNQTSVALFDFLLVILAVVSVVALWRGVAGARRARSPRPLVRSVATLITIAAAGYLWFLLAWGFNYAWPPLEAALGHDPSRVTPEAIRALGNRATDEVNRTHAAGHAAGFPAADEMPPALLRAIHEVERRLGRPRSMTPSRPKRTLLGWFFQAAGVDGMHTPFLLETLLNPDLTPPERPAVLAHEWAHLSGYAPENDASFVGLLAALRADPAAQYSAWLAVFHEAVVLLPRPEQGTQRPQLVVTTSTTDPDPDPDPSPASSVDVTLTPASGVSGSQRVNFAVPLATGQLYDPTKVRVLVGGVEIPAARRGLALHPDGSIRSVQIQVQTTVSAGKILQVRIGETPTTAALSLVKVSTTLTVADGSKGPRVWARLPAAWLSASGVTGPQIPEAQTLGAAAGAWNNACDYQNHTVTQFLSLAGSKDVWLYDRGTVMYRGYARRGDLLTLKSAYRETAIYRNGITGTGTATRIGVPGSSADLKYHYNQNLAIHYLLTGDNRFRETAENLAQRVSSLWSSPGYAGGSDFWTERHAGFGLLAYVWADIVTDDHGTKFQELADNAVDAYIAIQAKYPPNWTDTATRCFAHQRSAHGEGGASWGCSPWMSAILAACRT